MNPVMRMAARLRPGERGHETARQYLGDDGGVDGDRRRRSIERRPYGIVGARHRRADEADAAPQLLERHAGPVSFPGVRGGLEDVRERVAVERARPGAVPVDDHRAGVIRRDGERGSAGQAYLDLAGRRVPAATRSRAEAVARDEEAELPMQRILERDAEDDAAGDAIGVGGHVHDPLGLRRLPQRGDIADQADVPVALRVALKDAGEVDRPGAPDRRGEREIPLLDALLAEEYVGAHRRGARVGEDVDKPSRRRRGEAATHRRTARSPGRWR